MIGDRLLTDIVYGNRHGMLTIRTAPLTNRGEPTVVRLARRLEAAMSARWQQLNLRVRTSLVYFK
jgi:phosphatidylglycerophosphatase GEP4